MLLGWLLIVAMASADDFRGPVIHAASDTEKGVAYRRLFQHSKAGDLPLLQKDPDTGIALQAGWERARVPKHKKRSAGRIDWTYDPDRTAEFIRFFGERTGVTPPAWWKSIFLDIDLFPSRHHAFISGPGLKADFNVTKSADRWTIQQNGRTLSFPRTYFNGAPDVRSLAVVIGDDLAFVAPHDYGGGGTSFRLRCLDSKSGKELWRSDVWGSGRKMIAGFSNHDVSLVRKGTVIVAFGSESHSAYAEGFDVADGHCLFRFNSCYWFSFPETWKVPWSKQPPDSGR